MTTPLIDAAEKIIRLVASGPFNSTRMDRLAEAIDADTAVTRDAAAFLRDRGMLAYTTDADQDVFSVARVVGDGHLVASGTPLADFVSQPRSGTSVTNNVTGGTFNQQVGDSNTQSISISISRDQVLELIEVLRAEGLSDAADVIDAETDGGATPGRVINALVKAGPAMTAASNLGGVVEKIIGLLS